MAADIPTLEPREFKAGDTVKWTKSLDDYLASESWALTYYIRGPASLDVSATVDDDDFAVTISSASTSSLPKGIYRMEGKVSKAGEVFTVFNGQLEVFPNYTSTADVQAGYDPRSFNRRVRDALREMVEGIAKHPEISYTLFGERSVELIPKDQLLSMLSEFENRVITEEHQEEVNNNPGLRRGVYIRFRNPV